MRRRDLPLVYEPLALDISRIKFQNIHTNTNFRGKNCNSNKLSCPRDERREKSQSISCIFYQWIRQVVIVTCSYENVNKFISIRMWQRQHDASNLFIFSALILIALAFFTESSESWNEKSKKYQNLIQFVRAYIFILKFMGSVRVSFIK